MDPKKLVTGVVVGGATLYGLGILFWTVLFAGFFEGHAGTGTVVALETPIWWASIFGTLLLATLYTLVLGWAGAATPVDGLKIGALVGLLAWGGVDFILFAHFGFSDLVGTVSDAGLEAVRTGVAGALIVAVGGMLGGSASDG